MAIQTSGHIGADDVREEGAKISWNVPNYPIIPNSERLNIGYGWAQNRDLNHQLGRNLADDSVDWQVNFFGWNTWRVPIITDTGQAYLSGGIRPEVQQFNADSGARLVWEVKEGDAFRTGFVIERSSDGSFSAPTVEAIVRYANEYEDADFNISYCYDILSGASSYIRAMQSSVGFYNNTLWGTYESGDQSSTDDAESLFGTVTPTVRFSFVMPSLTGGPHWFRVRMIDGRLDHTLGSTPSNDTYTGIGNESTSLSNYDVKPGNDVYARDAYSSQFNSYESDEKGLTIFSGFGSHSPTNIQTDRLTITHQNVYSNYQSDGEIWVAYEEGTGGSKTPSSTDLWTKYPAPLPTITGLTEDTTYTFWVEPVREGDGNSPSTGPEPGGDFTATTEAVTQDRLDTPNVTNFMQIGDTGWDITWDDVIDAEGYRVYLKGDGQSSWDLVSDITDDGSASFSDNGNIGSRTKPVDVGVEAYASGFTDSYKAIETVI